MTTANTIKDTYAQEENKRIAKTPIFFYRDGKEAFVPLEEDIIDKLRLTRNDLFIQIVQGEDIVLRRFR
ncbi:MAG: hypothetical protein ACRD47_14765, partial [Nitrososphaeraceae archaeon]